MAAQRPDRLAGRRVVLRAIEAGDTARGARLRIVAGDRSAGVIALDPGTGRRGSRAWIDLLLERGPATDELGTDAVLTLVRHLADDRGHERIAVRPAADDVVAIRCYEQAGFRRVGVLRQARRDAQGAWRDALLMEWVSSARSGG
jgi:aminoglycoside 6'-N-acetyltransferase